VTYQSRLREEPFEFESDLAAELIDTEWEGEVNRSSRDYIKWVQQSLNRIMGLKLSTDGVMGTQTRSAIRSFQRQKRLTADGVVGTQTEGALIAAGVSPPPGTGAAPQPRPAPSAVPTLVKSKEMIPPAYTLYVDIPLQIPLGRAKSMTGIFVPEDYCPLSSVDLIIYLHGYKWRSHKPEYSIDTYWSLPRFLLQKK
jgi:hypothetical protein